MAMESTENESYFVFMNYDPEYERLRADRSVMYLHYIIYSFIIFWDKLCYMLFFLMNLLMSIASLHFVSFFYGLFFIYKRTKKGAYELDLYLSKKHDELLASTLEPGSYKKTLSLVIVDGFSVEITEDQVFLF